MNKVTARKGNLNEPLGNTIKWDRTESGLFIEAENATATVQFFDAETVRIRIKKHDTHNGEFSYAVSGTPVSTELTYSETNNSIKVSSSGLTVEVSLNPVRFNFFAPDGTLLSEESPAFGTSWIGTEVTTYRTLQKDEKFVGLGEKTGNLNRAGSAYTHWNTDKFGYATDADPLYLSTPFFMGLHSGKAYGIFLDNTYKSVFNFGASNHRFSTIAAEDGDLDYYFFHGNSVPDIIQAYARLTGTMPMPPKWALGYHQCRYSYYPDTEVLNMAQTFREKGIPGDVIYLDIHYMDAYKVFTFHPERFPDPLKMAKELEKFGFRLALIIDPGVKVEEGYETYEEGLKEGQFVTYPDREPFEADVWPGKSAFPDFTHPETRDWWAKWTKFYTDNGVSGFWNDMNEPAVWGQTVPNLIEFHFEGEGATHKRARNVFGMQMARSTYQGVKSHMKGKRPFVLTRAGFSGIQRYSAVWTGDNVGTDEHMMLGVRLVNSLGLTGVAFAGPDVGGFAGEPSPGLMARWMAIGAFTPFFRGHSMVNSRAAEPWSFGEEAEEIIRNFIRLRYRLMPYLYSNFREAAQSGIPVARSLAMYWPDENRVYDGRYQNQFLFGPSIMVVPVESDRDIVKAFVPGEGQFWLEIMDGKSYEGGEEYFIETPKRLIPVFMREGAIIPMQSQVQSMMDAPEEVLELHILPGTDRSEFLFYDDDGETYQFEDGKYYQRLISVDTQLIQSDDAESEQISIELDTVEGTYSSHFKKAKIFLYGRENKDEAGFFMVEGKKNAGEWTHHTFMEPISAFDPTGQERPYAAHLVHTVEFDLKKDKIVIEAHY